MVLFIFICFYDLDIIGKKLGGSEGERKGKDGNKGGVREGVMKINKYMDIRFLPTYLSYLS